MVRPAAPKGRRVAASFLAVTSGALAATSACSSKAATPATAIATQPSAPVSTTSPQRPASTPVAVDLIGGIVLAGQGSSAQPAGVARYCVRLLASLPPSCPAAPYGVELRGLGSIHVPWTGRKGGWRWADYVVVEGVLDDGVMTVSRVAKVLAPG